MNSSIHKQYATFEAKHLKRVVDWKNWQLS